MRHFSAALLSVLVAAPVALLAACGAKPDQQASSTEGLSADGDAKNVAIMVMGNVPESANDVRLIDEALTDPVGDYGFTIAPVANATSATMLSTITAKSAEVGENGTLFIYIGSHGSPDGGSQMNDGRLVHYREVRDALAQGRTTPVHRLVFVIFSCYSGSWINNIDRTDGNPEHASDVDAAQAFDELAADQGVLYDQLMVLTSSSAGQLSYYQPGGNSHLATSFSRTFAGLHKQAATATMGDLINGIRSGVRSSTVAYRVMPESMLTEPLYNSAMHH